MLLFGTVSQGLANVVTVTATGEVAPICGVQCTTDYLGLFGPVGADLSGDSVKVVYVFDTSLGIISSSSTGVSTYGGSEYSVPSPSLSAMITINAQSVSFVGSFSSVIRGGNDGTGITDANQAVSLSNASGIIALSTQLVNFTGTLPASITTPFDYNVVPSDIANGTFAEQVNSPVVTSDYLSFTVSNMTLTTPLPTALPLFAFGLGAMGLLGWRRKRKNAAAIAAA
jgi:hypothetical protein